MADLIDRREAIEAFETAAKGGASIKDITLILESLPGTKIIKCKDCEWWTKQENSIQGRCALHKMYPSGNWYCGTARRRGEQE